MAAGVQYMQTGGKQGYGRYPVQLHVLQQLLLSCRTAEVASVHSPKVVHSVVQSRGLMVWQSIQPSSLLLSVLHAISTTLSCRHVLTPANGHVSLVQCCTLVCRHVVAAIRPSATEYYVVV